VSFAANDKVYDGNTLATVAGSDNRISGDQLTVAHAPALFANKDVGSQSVSIGGLALTGSDAGNYTVASSASSAAAIKRLASVTWTGGATGNWFDPANWAGGAVPDLSNVAEVIIPAGVTITFGAPVVAPAEAGPVNVDRIGSAGSLNVAAGSLNVGGGGIALQSWTQSGGRVTNAGATSVADFSQTGGELSMGGNFTVTRSFSQLASGRITVGGDANITTTVGGVQIGNFDAHGNLNMGAQDGAVIQVPGSTITVQGSTALSARQHGAPADIVLGEAGNDFVGRVSVDGRNVVLADANALALSTVLTTGSLTLQSRGDLNLGSGSVGGTLDARSGNGDITQNGPLTVGQAATLDAGAGRIALAQPGNQWRGGVNARGGQVVIGNAGAQSLDSLQAPPALPGEVNRDGQGGLSQMAAGSGANGMSGVGSSAMAMGASAIGDGAQGSAVAELGTGARPAASQGQGQVQGQVPGQVQGSAAAQAQSAQSGGGVTVLQVRDANASGAVAILAQVDASAMVTGSFSFSLPAASATRVRELGITPVATLPNGAPLPGWIQFDGGSLRFTGKQVPAGGLPLKVKLSGDGWSAVVEIVAVS
jgi:hypothetical protein